ncbi:MAG: hypothetical protein WBW71_08220 [Bacteroidota bacterium]
MPENLSIELRCNKNNGGSFTAHTYINGKKKDEAEFSVNRGNLDLIVLLHAKVKKLYPSAKIRVKGLDKMSMDMILRAERSEPQASERK